jgi:hypothetical protein
VTLGLQGHLVSPALLVSLERLETLVLLVSLVFLAKQALVAHPAHRVLLAAKVSLARQVPAVPLVQVALTRQWVH